MITRHSNSGLYKRCDCPRRQWLKCAHSWHFDFFKGRKFRFSLDKIARARDERPPRSKGDAEALADRVRSEICSGTFRDPNQPEPPKPESGAGLTVGDAERREDVANVRAADPTDAGQSFVAVHVAGPVLRGPR